MKNPTLGFWRAILAITSCTASRTASRETIVLLGVRSWGTHIHLTSYIISGLELPSYQATIHTIVGIVVMIK